MLCGFSRRSTLEEGLQLLLVSMELVAPWGVALVPKQKSAAKCFNSAAESSVVFTSPQPPPQLGRSSEAARGMVQQAR